MALPATWKGTLLKDALNIGEGLFIKWTMHSNKKAKKIIALPSVGIDIPSSPGGVRIRVLELLEFEDPLRGWVSVPGPSSLWVLCIQGRRAYCN